jgi:hypothetical protein
MVNSTAGQIVAQGIRIVEATGGELIEWRIRIGRTFIVRWQRQCCLPYPHLGPGRYEACKQQENKDSLRERQQTVVAGAHTIHMVLLEHAFYSYLNRHAELAKDA